MMAKRNLFIPDSRMDGLVTSDLNRFKELMGQSELDLPVDPGFVAEVVLKYTCVEDSFSKLGIYKEDESKKILGGIWPKGSLFANDQDKVLAVNLDAERPEVVRRFTLAHELGHASLHFDRGECRGQLTMFEPEQETKDEPIRCRVNLQSEPLEIQANMYASRLLMPADIIFQSIEGKAVDLEKKTRSLQNQFMVSRQALEYRLQNLGYQLINRMYPDEGEKNINLFIQED